MTNMDYHMLIHKIQREFEQERYIFDDKIRFKEFVSNEVKTPKTHAFITDIRDYTSFWKAQEGLSEFVFKPNHLSRGRFIYVLHKEREWLQEHDGTRIRSENFKEISRQVLLSSSSTARPGVIIEEVIHSHPDLRALWGADQGIGDMRLFLIHDKILFGKFRMPSKQSRYYANVSRGAPCVHVTNKGIIEESNFSINTANAYHPDIPDKNLSGTPIPFWKEFERAGLAIARLFKVPFHSVDLTVDETGTAVVLESEFTPMLSYITPAGMGFILKHLQEQD